MKRYLFPRKIYYASDGDRGITPCPHGGSIAGDTGLYRSGVVSPNAKVGSGACRHCMFNKGDECGYVLCNRKGA